MLASPGARLSTVGVLCAFLVGIFVLGGANAPALHTAQIETAISDDAADTDGASLVATSFFDGSVLPTILRTDPADRRPWEVRYMYGVSVIAAVWVAARALVGWRVNLRALAVEPRERPRFTRSRDSPPVSEHLSDDA